MSLFTGNGSVYRFGILYIKSHEALPGGKEEPVKSKLSRWRTCTRCGENECFSWRWINRQAYEKKADFHKLALCSIDFFR